MNVSNSETYRIVFLGDIVGKPGRRAVLDAIPDIFVDYDPLFLIVNGENAAHGTGITPSIAEELFKAGVHAITLGNHAFKRAEIEPYLNQGQPIVRPANLPKGAPGRGWTVIEQSGVRLGVANLCGNVFLDGYDNPFSAIECILQEIETDHILIDFHAEATSEKVAFGYHVDSRATAVIGTHTHVPTADERVLPGGTAYITDVGMSGPANGVIGVSKEPVLHKFRTSLPARFEVAGGPGVICGVAIDVRKTTGRALAIKRIRLGP